MSRLEDLKQKAKKGGGFFSLPKEEQDEYQALKGTAEMVEIKKDELDGIIARLGKLEQEAKSGQKNAGLFTEDNEWRELEEDQKVYTATIRKWRKTASDPFLYTIGWQYDRDEFNEKTREKEQWYKFKFLNEKDEEVEAEMPILNFVKSAEREKVDIVEKKVKKLSKVVDYTHAVKVDYAKYKSEAGGKVPMTVTMEEVKCVVKLEDGRVIELSDKFLNA